MAIIEQEKNGVKYLFEVRYEKGKHKWKSLGRVDSQNGNEIIVSKKNRRRVLKNAPAELILKTIETKYLLRPKKKTRKNVKPDSLSISKIAANEIILDVEKIEKVKNE